MKTSKLLKIATIIAFTFALINTTGVLYAEQSSQTKFILEITLEEALQNPDLVMVMHQRIGQDFLRNTDAPVLTAEIYFGNVHVFITGTREQWTLFLHYRPDGASAKPLVN